MGKEKCTPKESAKKSKQAAKPKVSVKPKVKTIETPALEFPHMFRIIGPKHVKIAMQFVPSAIIYGVTSLILLTYMTDWKTVLQYFPYYNGKYYVERANDKKEED